MSTQQPQQPQPQQQPQQQVKFITFGSHSNYIEAGKRLFNQASSLKLFNHIKLYTFENLKSDPEFYNKHFDFILKNERGCGYWLWKPYLIHKNIQDMKNGDILLYLDCGCELDIRNRMKIAEMFHLVNKYKLITSSTQIELMWNKMDLLVELQMLQNEYLITPQKQAGAIVLLVCDETRKLVKDWYNIASSNKYHFIDDTPSIRQNINGFNEHRHDQSIFSLLVKKYGLSNQLNICDYVSYERNKTGTSQLHKKSLCFV